MNYPLYGLRESWPDARWLDFAEGAVGERVWTMWLGHASHQDSRRVLVGSASRSHFDEVHPRFPADPPTHVAFAVGLHMIGHTLPEGTIPRPPGLVDAVVEEMRRRTADVRNWEQVSWRIQDADVVARVWRFAGYWAAFTDDVTESYVMATGTEVDPEALRFERVLDGSSYGFELHSRLAYGSPQVPPVLARRPGRWHPNQLRLLDEP